MHAAIFGLIVADVIAQPMDLRRPPDPGGLHTLNSLTLTTGGNACNVSLAMAKLGSQVAAAGLIGADRLGASVLDQLRAAGVDVSCVFPTDRAQTSATVVAVEPGGERCFYHTPGATQFLDASLFRRCIPLFARCRFVQIGYFGLLPSLESDLPTLLAELRQAAPQTRIALDTVNPPAARSLLDPILPLLDVFAPSRHEARALTGESDPPRIVAALRRRMPRGLIGVKLDAEGCYLDDTRDAQLIPAYPIELIDATGAGDTWYAALLTALTHDMPLADAGRFANRAAADCCTALGASAGVRTFPETLARM